MKVLLAATLVSGTSAAVCAAVNTTGSIRIGLFNTISAGAGSPSLGSRVRTYLSCVERSDVATNPFTYDPLPRSISSPVDSTTGLAHDASTTHPS